MTVVGDVPQRDLDPQLLNSAPAAGSETNARTSRPGSTKPSTTARPCDVSAPTTITGIPGT